MQLPPAKPALQLASSDIPDKLYFRIGEVSRLAGVKPYVLRYWETEFASIAPKKSGTGHRLYRRKDVEIVLEIKRLLYEKRFTIEGARKALESSDEASFEEAVAEGVVPGATARSDGDSPAIARYSRYPPVVFLSAKHSGSSLQSRDGVADELVRYPR